MYRATYQLLLHDKNWLHEAIAKRGVSATMLRTLGIIFVKVPHVPQKTLNVWLQIFRPLRRLATA